LLSVVAPPVETESLLPAASPIQIAVEPLTSCADHPEVPVVPAALPLNITNILFEADVGVIDTDIPVMSTHAADVPVENVSVLVVLTTCNTLPAGIVFVVTIVPLVVGNVSVVVPATLGASNVIVPDVFPEIITLDIILLLIC
jgi:hypothetical protein